MSHLLYVQEVFFNNQLLIRYGQDFLDMKVLIIIIIGFFNDKWKRDKSRHLAIRTESSRPTEIVPLQDILDL